MARIKQLKNKLLLTALYLAILIIFWSLGMDCIYKSIFNINCPGCGMTRAVISALQLNLAAAFKFHPMFWSLPVLYAYFLFDGNIFNKKYIDYGILILIAVGFLINWIVKLW